MQPTNITTRVSRAQHVLEEVLMTSAVVSYWAIAGLCFLDALSFWSLRLLVMLGGPIVAFMPAAIGITRTAREAGARQESMSRQLFVLGCGSAMLMVTLQANTMLLAWFVGFAVVIGFTILSPRLAGTTKNQGSRA